MRTKRVMQHSADCYAVRNVADKSWASAWFIDPRNVKEYRDLAGRARKGAWRSWIVLRCNCTTCPAQLLVLEEDLIAALKIPA